MTRTRKSIPIIIYHTAQYAMYAYCIFAFLSLAISVCGELGMPISMGRTVLTVEHLLLRLTPIVLWAMFSLALPADTRLLRYCSKVVTMLKSPGLRKCMTKRNRAKNLMKLDVPRWAAYNIAYCGDKYARLARNGWVHKAISTRRLSQFGLVSMLDYYTERCVTC